MSAPHTVAVNLTALPDGWRVSCTYSPHSVFTERRPLVEWMAVAYAPETRGSLRRATAHALRALADDLEAAERLV